jgi:hypothetical protein
LRGGLLIIAVTAALVAPAAASAAPVTFEGESMTLGAGGPGGPRSDANASGGQTMALLNNVGASKSLATSARYTRIVVHARGSQCSGAPQMEIMVDSAVVATLAVPSTSYGDYDAGIELPAGSHTISVRMTNDLSQAGNPLQPGCDRNLYVDVVRLIGLFDSGSYVNTKLSASTPIDPNSAALVQRIVDDAHTYGTHINAWTCSAPVYRVPATQARVQVKTAGDNANNQALQAQWNDVPLPSNAKAADCTDQTLIVYQPATDTMWEFWHFKKDVLGRPTADFGGRMPNVSTNPGHFTDPPGTGYGASATSIPYLVGLQTIAEATATGGPRFDHVIAFAMPSSDGHVWPAQREDAEDLNPMPLNPVPEGKRFRFPPGLDLSALGLPPYALAIAKAIQDYGMVLRDRGGTVSFYAEDPTPTGSNPYPAVWGTPYADQNNLLKNFPWDKLVAVADTTGP